MATHEEQSDLVVQTVRDLSTLAADTYQEAKETLDTLSQSVTELPLTLVDTNIGVNTPISWAANISSVSIDPFPAFLEQYLNSLPAAPVTSAVSVSVPDGPEEAPELGPGVNASDLSLSPLPSLGALPTLEAAGNAPAVPTLGTLPAAPSRTELPAAPALGDLPAIPTASALPAAPILGELPPIEGLIPVVDPAVLDASFSYTEGEYVPLLKDDIQAELTRVLGGDLGIPQSYWDALWQKSAGDLALQQQGRLRNARNRGAASFWSLPSEAALAGSRVVQDEGAKAIQVNRLQQAVAQAAMAREDFWAAVEKGIAFEQQWIGMYEQAATRSLSSAETLLNSQIQVYNANIARYNLLLEAGKASVLEAKADADVTLQAFASKSQLFGTESQNVHTMFANALKAFDSESGTVLKTFDTEVRAYGVETDAQIKAESLDLQAFDTESKVATTVFDSEVRAYGTNSDAFVKLRDMVLREYQIQVETTLKTLETELTASKTEIEQARTRIQDYQAQWEAKLGNDGRLVQLFGESVRAWSAEIDGNVKAQQLELAKTDTDAKIHATLFGAINGMASAASAINQGGLAGQKLNLDAEGAQVKQEQLVNAASLDVSRITQAAQQASAQIDVAQSQWTAGQASALEQRIAELSWGYAQAAVSASDVNLGSSASIGLDNATYNPESGEVMWIPS